MREKCRIYLTDWPTFGQHTKYAGTGRFERAPQRLLQVEMLHCSGSEPVQLTVIMLQVRGDFFYNRDAAMGKYTILLQIMKKTPKSSWSWWISTVGLVNILTYMCSQNGKPTSSFQYHKDLACTFNPAPKNVIGNTVDSKLKMCVLSVIQIG